MFEHRRLAWSCKPSTRNIVRTQDAIAPTTAAREPGSKTSAPFRRSEGHVHSPPKRPPYLPVTNFANSSRVWVYFEILK